MYLQVVQVGDLTTDSWPRADDERKVYLILSRHG